jgi:hypothetical protein
LSAKENGRRSGVLGYSPGSIAHAVVEHVAIGVGLCGGFVVARDWAFDLEPLRSPAAVFGLPLEN